MRVDKITLISLSGAGLLCRCTTYASICRSALPVYDARLQVVQVNFLVASLAW
jgi:aerobic-type carbon monoxide dehydrogenase small subunit (CoxS/CutS family)